MRQLSVLIYDKVFKSIVAVSAILQTLSKDAEPNLHQPSYSYVLYKL